MLALSIRFPFVALVAQKLKTVEVRSWPTQHRGDLLICSSKLTPAEQREELYQGVPSGCHVAVVELKDCQPFRRKDAKAAWCGYQAGLYAWHLELRYWTQATPVRGVVKLYSVPDATIRRARRIPSWLLRTEP